ncbi:MAG TPA: ATP-binding protein [Cellulomonas sp.]
MERDVHDPDQVRFESQTGGAARVLRSDHGRNEVVRCPLGEQVLHSTTIYRGPGWTGQARALVLRDLEGAEIAGPRCSPSGVVGRGHPGRSRKNLKFVRIRLKVEESRNRTLAVSLEAFYRRAVIGVRKLLIGSAAGFAAAVGLGLVARPRPQPVRLLTRAVRHAVEAEDFQAVTIDATGEVKALASWLNELLRLVGLMRERHRRLILDTSHELRNPLTSLRTNVDLLVTDLRQERLSSDQRAEVIADVQAQLVEVSGLVSDLSLRGCDDGEPRLDPLDVGEVVRTAVERVRRRGPDNVFEVDLQPLFMVGDALALCGAVVNLLDNAVKWSPPGGTIKVQLEGNRLRVSDEGPGIPEADLPYVFDRYFRGASGRDTPGTGLGLSIVARSVENHGGSVRAGRAASGGAELTLQLPGVTSREALPRLPQRSRDRLADARSVEADTQGAATIAKRAVLTAADTTNAAAAAAEEAHAAAAAAKQARAAATAETARAVAETVRQHASMVQGEADAAAQEVAAAAARAASRVHAAVLPGQEVEARRAAALVAQTATEAATAIAADTAQVAEAAARAAADAARQAAAEAADAARLVELEVYTTARAVQDTAAAAVAQAAQAQEPA